MNALKSLFGSVLAAILLTAGSPALAADPTGTWEGTIVVYPGKFEVDFTLELEEAGGRTAGFITVPVQQVARTSLEEVEVDGRQVSFTYRDAKDTSRFAGLIDPGGDRIRGSMSERGGEHSFELRRVEDPRPDREQIELLDASLLQTVFHEAAGSVRIVAVVAPDCIMCRVGSRLIQRYVLDEIADPRLEVYALWEALDEDDTPEAARIAARLFEDPRVTHFWSEDLAPGARLLADLDVAEARPMDVYLVYGPDATWDDRPPRPVRWFHNNGKMPAEHDFAASELSQAVWSLLLEGGSEGAAESP